MYFDTFLSIFSWKAAIDIFLVGSLFYQIISMLKGTRAAQVLIGMLVIFVAYVFSSVLQFETLHWIISRFFSSFIIVVIVLFQDDIRRLLSRFGKGAFFSGLASTQNGMHILEEVINSARSLSHERIGALIVFERSIGLDKLHDHSVKIDGLISEQLLGSLFQSFSPLHDGAVIIQKNRLSCASAQLPLSKNPRFSKKLGTRHSAAVGISEETDAVVLVVSEETGSISIAWEGNIQKQSSPEIAKKMLSVLLMPRGEIHVFQSWLEDTIFYRYNKFILKWNQWFGKKRVPTIEIERRQQPERRMGGAGTMSLEALALSQIESENKQAAASSKHIYIQFPKNSKIREVLSLENQFVLTSNILQKEVQKMTAHLPEPTLSDFHLTEEQRSVSGKKEALKNLTELSKEDRFDPPLPKSPAPRDVLIGGVPLNPPKDGTKI